MRNLLSDLHLPIEPSLYVKDPETTDLGKKVISGSIRLIFDIGFEQFTFKKLAKSIDSTEASVYRYFENKQKLFQYLINWYWTWMEYRVILATQNIEDPSETLERALDVVLAKVEYDDRFTYVREDILNKIIDRDGIKAFSNVDAEQNNAEGVFSAYNTLVSRLASCIQACAPNYPYPRMLVTALLENMHHQRFFALHLPKLTDSRPNEDSVKEFSKHLVQSIILPKCL